MLRVTGKQGAGLRAEHAVCTVPEASRDRCKQRQSLENRVWSGLGAARAILVEAVWGEQVSMETARHSDRMVGEDGWA